MKPNLQEGSLVYPTSATKIIAITSKGKFVLEGEEIEDIVKIIQRSKGIRNTDEIASEIGLSQLRVARLCEQLIDLDILTDLDSKQIVQTVNDSIMGTLIICGLSNIGLRIAELMAKKARNILLFDEKKVSAEDCKNDFYSSSQIGLKRVIAAKKNFEKFNAITNIDVIHDLDIEKIKADALVLVTASSSIQRFKEFNYACMKNRKIRFLGIRPFGFKTEIGPLVVPGQTACFSCYLSRRIASASSELDKSLVETDAEFERPLLANDGIMNTLISSMACILLVKSIEHKTSENFCIVDSQGKVSWKTILRAPNCQICSI